MRALWRSIAATRRLLVVLEDAATADQVVVPLIPATSTCLVVVTSRSPLPALAALGAHHHQLGLLAPVHAVQLLGRILGEGRVRAAASLEQTDLQDGYPYFRLLHAGSAPGRSPKNLVFASSTKPDIRFLSAVDNDIEVVQGLDEVLYYDRPTGPDGLRWHELLQWWQDATGTTDDDDAKATLYNRLMACQPDENNSPQIHLFRLYHRIHGRHIPHLPALLPEVWLHWDPRTVRQRGVDALHATGWTSSCSYPTAGEWSWRSTAATTTPKQAPTPTP
ncbi:hypothetical protein [Kitasatospora brasiliensis]|uniref:hypothetical protein n=1 Tax=Kitasatospora brasiliensis TaxID=3058040 RepID=UPI00292E0E5E|nr:hypothetical protein [Kitasatospora sp. K002]